MDTTQVQHSNATHKTKVASKACIFKDGRMLVLYKPEEARLRGAASERTEDLPGGCVEYGESFIEALIREVSEETGLKIQIGQPFHTWSIVKPNRHILGVDFIAFWEGGDVYLSHEHVAYEWLTLDELQAKDWQQIEVYEKAFQLALGQTA
jgi:8-oxo-dGTP diphosphatase